MGMPTEPFEFDGSRWVAAADYERVTSAVIVDLLGQHQVVLTADQAAHLWSWYSGTRCASWLCLSDPPDREVMRAFLDWSEAGYPVREE